MGRRRKDDRPRPPWAEAILHARIARGFANQAALAAALGYSQQRVADWESGKARPPPEAVPELSRVLDLAPQLLLPPGLAAVMEPQAALSTPAAVDDALAALVGEIHEALTEAGGRPTIQHATRLALGAWRLSGGTSSDLADPHALRLQVQNLRELWRDLTKVPRADG